MDDEWPFRPHVGLKKNRAIISRHLECMSRRAAHPSRKTLLLPSYRNRWDDALISFSSLARKCVPKICDNATKKKERPNQTCGNQMSNGKNNIERAPRERDFEINVRGRTPHLSLDFRSCPIFIDPESKRRRKVHSHPQQSFMCFAQFLNISTLTLPRFFVQPAIHLILKNFNVR